MSPVLFGNRSLCGWPANCFFGRDSVGGEKFSVPAGRVTARDVLAAV